MFLQSLFKKYAHEDLEALRDITDDVQEQDFIPYACHYNPHTLLTKNGELLQTIKVTGFFYERIGSDAPDLRQTLRKAVLEHIPSNDYALWIHTIRRKKNFDLGGDYPDSFTRYTNRAWQEQGGWQHKFSNELYITIVRDGQSGSLLDPGNFLRGLLPAADRKHRERYLQEVYPGLDAVVLAMLETLKAFGARRLSLVEKDGVFYSETCNFLGKIVNLTDIDMPAPNIDLSDYLTTQEITFGYNAMEVRSHQGTRRFGAILTLKEYKELTAEAMDRFMQLPVEFVVTQCVDFINSQKALSDYERQDYLSQLAGDQALARGSGLEDILKSNRNRTTDYGEQQLSVFLQADNVRQLERYVKQAVDTLFSLGIICVREDLKFEEAYWAQMPGNFEFVKRLKSINTRRIAGFANLNNFPAGKEKGNHWGDAVTVFYTAAKTPYFFNFHIGSNGHTTVIGPAGGGKTVLINFLLSEARKFRARMFFFDKDRTSEIYLRATGGEYYHFTPQGIVPSAGLTAPTLNPLQLRDEEKNRRYLFIWLMTLIGEMEETLPEQTAALLRAAVEHNFTLAKEQRTLREIKHFLAAQDTTLAEQFSSWLEGGAHAALFDHPEDTLALEGGRIGFELAPLMEDERAFLPVFSYLLHRITSLLDGAPTILVLKEAWQMLDNHLYARRVESWLDMLCKQNAMAILAAENIEETEQSALSRNLMDRIATQIYLPNAEPVEMYKTVFKLSEREFEYLRLMDVAKRHFLLKRGSETIVAELNLAGLDDIIAVLSGDVEQIARMERSIAQHGPKAQQWLAAFLKGIREDEMAA